MASGLAWVQCWRRLVEARQWLGPRVVEAVFPRTCLCCGRYLRAEDGGFTCGPCFSAYAFIGESFCSRCGSPHLTQLVPEALCARCREQPPVFDAARSLIKYSGTGARLIHALKYESGIWAELEVERIMRQSGYRWAYSGALLVPVPLHARKLRQRGYNQAMVVAMGLQRAWPNLRIWNGLKRTRNTPSQTALSRRQRQRNVDGAFQCGSGPVPVGHLVLVDDVLTTGATLNDAARALRAAGAGSISAFTLAHG
jgi:ComF family protein